MGLPTITVPQYTLTIQSSEKEPKNQKKSDQYRMSNL